jgi:hypothetical protein
VSAILARRARFAGTCNIAAAKPHLSIELFETRADFRLQRHEIIP